MPVVEIGLTRKQQTLSAGETDPSNMGSVIGERRMGWSSALVMGDIAQGLQAVYRSILIMYWKKMNVVPHNIMVVSGDKTPLNSR